MLTWEMSTPEGIEEGKGCETGEGEVRILVHWVALILAAVMKQPPVLVSGPGRNVIGDTVLGRWLSSLMSSFSDNLRTVEMR